MRVLITGATGFVGSYLAELCLEKGCEVYGTKRLQSPMDNVNSIKDKVHWLECELADCLSVRAAVKASKPDLVFHLGAESYIPTSFKKPVESVITNTIGTLYLLEAIRLEGLDPKIHVCSTSETYGKILPTETPVTESQPFRPQNPYGVSKLGADLFGGMYYTVYGLKTYMTRAFSHDGPRRGDKFAMSSFAKQIALIEAGLQEPVIKVGNLDSVRTYCDARDMATAYWLLLEKGTPGEVYNIGGVETMTIRDMLDTLITMSSRKDITIEVDTVRLRPVDVTLQISDSSKFKEATGWSPTISVKQMLLDTLQFWRVEISRQ